MVCAQAGGLAFKSPKIDYGKRHMQTLPRWMALCRGNYVDSLVRAAALMHEYSVRFGKVHCHAAQMMWLLRNVVDFETERWERWVERERRGVDVKKRLYVDWFADYGRFVDGAHEGVWELTQPAVGSIGNGQRNSGRMTHFPQIMDDDVFVGCRDKGDAVAAGRKHYVMKARGFGMKERMRYLYRAPPAWLVEGGVVVQLKRR